MEDRRRWSCELGSVCLCSFDANGARHFSASCNVTRAMLRRTMMAHALCTLHAVCRCVSPIAPMNMCWADRTATNRPRNELRNTLFYFTFAFIYFFNIFFTFLALRVKKKIRITCQSCEMFINYLSVIFPRVRNSNASIVMLNILWLLLALAAEETKFSPKKKWKQKIDKWIFVVII